MRTWPLELGTHLNETCVRHDHIDIGWYEVQGLTFDLAGTGPLFSHRLPVDVQ